MDETANSPFWAAGEAGRADFLIFHCSHPLAPLRGSWGVLGGFSQRGAFDVFGTPERLPGFEPGRRFPILGGYRVMPSNGSMAAAVMIRVLPWRLRASTSRLSPVTR